MAPKYLKPKKKSYKPLIIGLVLTVVVVCGLLIFLFSKGSRKLSAIPIGTETQQVLSTDSAEIPAAEAVAMEGSALLMPWEAEGAKQPEEYTLEEYEALTAEQRKAFLNYLGAAKYAAWLERAEEEAAKSVEIPWNTEGAKQPKEYSMADFQALTEGQQKAFMEALGPYELEVWLQQVMGGGSKKPGTSVSSGTNSQSGNKNQSGNSSLGSITISGGNNNYGISNFYPWEKKGAKKAQDYTWEDYDALSSAQKKAFRDHLDSGFEAWLEKVMAAEYPWLEEGAKQPADYTWAEFTALTENQKKAFQEKLGASGYTKWQNEALSQDSNYPWSKSNAKQPKDYTWANYTALTEVQQAAFQDHLGESGMKAWLRKVTDIPWELANAKQPGQYTLKEYEKLKAPQQLAFRIYLGFAEFDAWMIEAKNPAEANPWDKPGAKQPKDYTLKEFNALTSAQQMAFQNHLGAKGFESWMNKVQEKTAANPWEKSGAKQPKDYTWAEFNALTAAQQMAFQNHLGSKGFETWLKKVQPKPSTDPTTKPTSNPWDKAGAKQPKDYTWAEFNALTEAQQMAFQDHLGSSGFDAWLKKVQEKPSTSPSVNPWDAPGAKQPADYSWNEFNALTAAQQMAFQNYLGSSGFEAWMNKVQSQPTSQNPWNAPGAKQPADYSWNEFEALTAAQQMAFQNHLGSAGFEAWLNKVQEKPVVPPTVAPTDEPTFVPTTEATEATEAPSIAPMAEVAGNPWEIPGAKQPLEYTKEEYEQLTEEQKLAFQDFLGAEVFEAWLNQ